MGFGSDAWDRLFGSPRPAELHPFREIRSGPRHAVSTAGDLIFHIRAKRMDLCFELATQIMDRLTAPFVPPTKCTVSVTSTNGICSALWTALRIPRATRLMRPSSLAARIRLSQAEATSSSKSISTISKPGTDLPTEAQEKIIGRSKVSDIELDDSMKPTSAHNALTTIEENGVEIKILRDNMPFGDQAAANSAPISSAIADRLARSNKCSKTCSSGGRRGTTIASSTSVLRSREACFSFPLPRFSTHFP